MRQIIVMNEDGRQQVVFAVVVRVDRSLRQVRSIGNAVDAGAGKARPPEACVCRVDDALSGLLRFHAHLRLRPKVYRVVNLHHCSILKWFLSRILRAKPINRLRTVDAGYAISIAYDQKHQSDPGCPETEAARDRAHRDHYRLARHIDRSEEHTSELQ